MSKSLPMKGLKYGLVVGLLFALYLGGTNCGVSFGGTSSTCNVITYPLSFIGFFLVLPGLFLASLLGIRVDNSIGVALCIVILTSFLGYLAGYIIQKIKRKQP